MKSNYILFCLTSIFLLTSCNKGGLVDKSKPKSRYYYSLFKKNIWYRHSTAPDVSQLWDYDWIKVTADAKTFVVLENGFAKDKNHIFWGTNSIDNVDYATFKSEKNYILKDKNHVYLTVYGGKLKILEGANPATYKTITLNNDEHDALNYYWKKDDKHYFLRDTVADVDHATFNLITPYIYYDKNYIYHYEYNKGLMKMPNRNPLNSKYFVLSGDVIRTDKYFYFYGEIGTNVDGILEFPIVNPASVKMYCYKDYFTIDGVVYFDGTKIQNADVASFDTFEKEHAVWFAKDKNHVYQGVNIIPGANPKTVTYNKEKNTIEEGDYIWKWSETQVKKLIKTKKSVKNSQQ
ncbi:hypothetical protein EZJ43_07770 [Pedobacter changchengzhani]|uniref:DKNYY family protein n=1 Tax=Pedobacter changchengzhani TaxID=2529274 RepID=A0A4R5MKZ0_9SPHI|nr:DKNYY domain-containing protein [Pedobacter changchengzhani]TDG36407.1 hypothetical protein EZJ43_07770 [Pedobacter changchengzhani]